MEQDMQYIYQVWKDGSFSKAAEHLYLTQPALSIAVKRVEETVGAELFDRKSRPLSLTEAGRAYIETIERVQVLEEDLQRRIGDLNHLISGSLHIGGTHYLNAYILAPILSGFSRKYPGVKLEITEQGAASLNKALAARDLDLIFSCDPEMVTHYPGRPIFSDNILLAVHEDRPLPDEVWKMGLSAEEVMQGLHLKPETPSVPLSAFRDLEFILLSPGNNLCERSRIMFEEAGFTPRIRMSISQMVTSYRFADNDLGAAFISDRLVRSPRSHLRFYRIDSEQTERVFCALLPHRSYTPRAAQVFLEYAEDCLAD